MSHARRSIWGWALFDTANSAFSLLVITTFYPIFFRQYWSAGVADAQVTSRLSFGIAAATVLVALAAPFLGALADASGWRRRGVIISSIVACAATFVLSLIGSGQWQFALSAYALALMAYYCANLFYDALLTNVTSPERYQQVSAIGYAIGYIGSAALMGVCAYMVSSPQTFGLADATSAVRLTFAIVAIWWFVFMLPLAFLVREARVGDHDSVGIVAAYRQVVSTVRDISQYRNVALFLLAYWLYIDGVHTFILLASDFGLRLGISTDNLILAILATNIVAAPATLAFAFLGRRIGARPTIYIGIAFYITIAMYGLRVSATWEFYAMAVGIGLVQGTVQSQSRAFFATLVPPDRAAQFFGFYSMLGKFAAILGPLLVGIFASFSDNPRVSVFAILPLFVLGLLALTRVQLPSARASDV
ncbi:MAG: MFS transporter [Pseudomonadota bacterium]